MRDASNAIGIFTDNRGFPIRSPLSNLAGLFKRCSYVGHTKKCSEFPLKNCYWPFCCIDWKGKFTTRRVLGVRDLWSSVTWWISSAVSGVTYCWFYLISGTHSTGNSVPVMTYVTFCNDKLLVSCCNDQDKPLPSLLVTSHHTIYVH